MRGFAKQPEYLLMIGELGKMFGKFPHEILELDPYELGLCMLVYTERDRASTRLIEQMATAGTPVFPTVVLKG